MGIIDKIFKKHKENKIRGEFLEQQFDPSSDSTSNEEVLDDNTSNEEFLDDNTSNEEVLDDITFIREMKHTVAGPWHQYDILLDARGYGWDNMIEWADYMAQADLEHINQVTTGVLGAQEKNITESYSKNGGKCSQTPELKTEMNMLSIAGMSRTLNAPVKIVWFNQTRFFRLFTLIDNEMLMTKYIETVIRRIFGTKDAMKLAKPIPPEN